MRKIAKILGSVLCSMFLLVATFTTVFAADAQGPTTYATVYGYSYHHYSSVISDTSGAWSFVHPGCSVNAPTGYMGGYPRLYNSNGSLVREGDWTYNDQASSGMGLSTGKHYASGTFKGWGKVRYYNGRGYSEYTTTETPYVQVRSLQEAPLSPLYAEYQINENGQTYGSDYFAEYKGGTPDLILAIGNNGIEGYVKNTDLNLHHNPKTPEEAVLYMLSGVGIKTIECL